jgi:hypothetical protein
MSIVGTRGATGKKTLNSGTMYNSLFENTEPELSAVDDSELDQSALDELEKDE